MDSSNQILLPEETLGDQFLYYLWRVWNALAWIWVLLGWLIAGIVMAVGSSHGQTVVALVGVGIFVAWCMTWGALVGDD